MAIILASQSPRRQELLRRIGIESFKTLSLDIDESYPAGLSPPSAPESATRTAA